MNQVVIDEAGVWVTNKGAFPFIDPITEVRFEPNIPTKVLVTDWIKGQVVLEVSLPEPAKPAKKAT